MNLEFFLNDRYKILQCMADRQIQIKDKKIIPLSQQDISVLVNLSKKKVNIIVNELKENGYAVQQSSTRGKYSLTSKSVEILYQMRNHMCEIQYKRKNIIFSFFSGSGFLDLGFEKSDFAVEFVNEYSKSFINAYIYSREKMNMSKPKYGYQNTDINEYFNGRKEELRAFIIDARKNNVLIGFIGGPPCPDFSVGGKNKGQNGDNGKLSSIYIDLIIEMQPDFFLFENVKGLWYTIRHRTFYEELKSKLHNAGYCTTERLTNAIEFAVPQDRDRILLFGVKKNLLNKKFYSNNELSKFPWNTYQKYNIDEIKNKIWPETNNFIENSLIASDIDTIKELTVQYWFEKNDVEQHPNARAYFTPRNGLGKMQTIPEGDVSRKSYKRLHRWRYSPTAAYGNNEVHLHPYKARRISASEAMALQSLPKEFELPADMRLSDMFKTIGNGVPFLLSKAIADTIRDYLDMAIYTE